VSGDVSAITWILIKELVIDLFHVTFIKTINGRIANYTADSDKKLI